MALQSSKFGLSFSQQISSTGIQPQISIVMCSFVHIIMYALRHYNIAWSCAQLTIATFYEHANSAMAFIFAVHESYRSRLIEAITCNLHAEQIII